VPAVVDQALFFIGANSQPGSSPMVSYDWDFGDGDTDSGELVNHAFAAPGDYTVTLSVTDEDGLSATATQVVQVAEPQPEPSQ
jgi:PKD repeat protein